MKFDRDTGKPQWSPRVSMEKIRRLYRNDASGIVDEELLDDIGITLYCRCESILDASDAALGKVHCPSCANIIMRASTDQHEQILCGQCGWTIRWITYQKTYQHKDLWGGGFASAMREFMARWRARPSAREKMLLIDRLIHFWHWQFSKERGASRPAAPTFIEGRRKEVIKFLDELSSNRC
jgi:ribosomal protein S27AE